MTRSPNYGQFRRPVPPPTSTRSPPCSPPCSLAVSPPGRDWPSSGRCRGSRPVPPALAAHPTWGPYLGARTELIGHCASVVRDQTTLTAEPPRGARPVRTDLDLWRDLAMWRAANDIPESDLIPAGRPVSPARERSYQRKLEARVNVLAGPRAPLPATGMELTREREPALFDDPYWPVMARRLPAADRQGQDLQQLLVTALAEGPLPEERPAAALCFRLAGELHLVRPRRRRHQTAAGVDRSSAPAAAGPGRAEFSPAPTGPGSSPRSPTAPHGPGYRPPTCSTLQWAPSNSATKRPVGLPADAVPAMLTWRLAELNTQPLHDLDDADLPPDPHDPETGRPLDLDDHYPKHEHQRLVPEPVDPTVHADDAGLAEPEDEPAGEDQADTTPRSLLVELNAAAAAWWADPYPGSPAAAYIAGRLGDDLTGNDRITIGYARPDGRTSPTTSKPVAPRTPSSSTPVWRNGPGAARSLT